MVNKIRLLLLMGIAGGLVGQTISGPATLLPGASGSYTCSPSCSWTLLTGSVGTLSSATSTSVVLTAPGSPVYSSHQEHGCPVAPNDAVWDTRIDSLPVLSSTGVWLTQTGSEFPFPISSWETNAIDSTYPISTSEIWYYTPLMNNVGIQWPTILSRYRENGGIAKPLFTDHHLVTLNTTTCEWYETYQDKKMESFTPSTSGCNSSMGLDTTCTGQSAFEYSGYSEASTIHGTTSASGTPYEVLIPQVSEMLVGAINHALPIIPAGGFVQLNPPPQGACSGCTVLWPANYSTGGAQATGASAGFPMGSRFRLKSGYSPGGTCNTYCQELITAYKEYGGIVNDLAYSFTFDVGSSLYSFPLIATGLSQFQSLHIYVNTTNWDIVDESSLMINPYSYNGFTFSPWYASNPNQSYEAIPNSMVLCASSVCNPVSITPTSIGFQDNIAIYIVGQTYVPKVIINGTSGIPTYLITNCSSSCGTYSGGMFTPPSSLTCGTYTTGWLNVSIGSATDIQLVTILPSPSSGCPLAFDNGNKTGVFVGSGGVNWLPDTFPRFNQNDSNISNYPSDSNFSKGPNGATLIDGTIYQTQPYASNDFYIGPIYGLSGNYDVSLYWGIGGGGNGAFCDSRGGWWSTGGILGLPKPTTLPNSIPLSIDMNGFLVSPSFDYLWNSGGYQCFVPVILTEPLTASSSTYLSVHSTEQSGTYSQISEFEGTLAGIKIVPDSSTTPYIQIVSEDGYARKTPNLQVASGGSLILVDNPWFISSYNQASTSWSVVSGPGTISSPNCTPIGCSVTYLPGTVSLTTPVVIQASNGGYSSQITLYAKGSEYVVY